MDDSCYHKYYQALYRVAVALGETMDTQVVLEQLVRGVVAALNLKAASIRLLTSEGTLETVAVHGLSAQYQQKGPVDIRHSAIDRQALTGDTVQIEDVAVDPRFEYPSEARQEGIVSAVFVPLVARSQPIGVLRVYTAEKRIFSAGEIDLLRALADLGALAITNARLYSACLRAQEMTTEALWSFHLPEEWLEG